MNRTEDNVIRLIDHARRVERARLARERSEAYHRAYCENSFIGVRQFVREYDPRSMAELIEIIAKCEKKERAT